MRFLFHFHIIDVIIKKEMLNYTISGGGVALYVEINVIRAVL